MLVVKVEYLHLPHDTQAVGRDNGPVMSGLMARAGLNWARAHAFPARPNISMPLPEHVQHAPLVDLVTQAGLAAPFRSACVPRGSSADPHPRLWAGHGLHPSQHIFGKQCPVIGHISLHHHADVQPAISGKVARKSRSSRLDLFMQAHAAASAGSAEVTDVDLAGDGGGDDGGATLLE